MKHLLLVPAEEQLAQQCKALGDPVRVRILHLLPKSPNCEHRNNVSQLSDLLGLSQPTISHHLKILKQAQLIESKKMCRDVFYWINDDKAETFLLEVRQAFFTRDGVAGVKSSLKSR